MYSAEELSKIAIWRARSEEGTITLEEEREFVVLMRAGRKTAITEKKPSRSRSAKAPVNTDQLLKELEGL